MAGENENEDQILLTVNDVMELRKEENRLKEEARKASIRYGEAKRRLEAAEILLADSQRPPI